MNFSESTTFNRFKREPLEKKLASGRSFFLFGPRQTGKSTLLKNIFQSLPNHQKLEIFFQLPSTRLQFEQDPEVLIRQVSALREKLPKKAGPIYVYIDEIQKVPTMLDVLQFLIDEKKIVLAASGSSARKLKQMKTNWLPGRMEMEYLSPLSWEEARIDQEEAFFQKALLFGTLPAIFQMSEEERMESLIQSYAALYLEEEIRVEAQVRKLPIFSQFLQLAALESGTSPNFSKLGSQVGLSHPTISNYYQILEDTLIVHRIDAFGSHRNQVVKTPRYYFFDLGLRNSTARIGHSVGLFPLQMGIFFEHFVVLEVCAYWKGKAKLSYWRTREGKEVDLIVEYRGERVAIEIKSTNKPTEDDFEGLNIFCSKNKCKASILICQASKAQKFEKHLALPWFEFKAKNLFK